MPASPLWSGSGPRPTSTSARSAHDSLRPILDLRSLAAGTTEGPPPAAVSRGRIDREAAIHGRRREPMSRPWRRFGSRAELAEDVGGRPGRLPEAEQRAARLAAALDEVVQGVVVCDDTGAVIYRNRPAQAFVGARHGEALAERALTELLAAAVAGTRRTETLELFGPPRRTLTITATPLGDGPDLVGAAAVVDDITER